MPAVDCLIEVTMHLIPKGMELTQDFADGFSLIYPTNWEDLTEDSPDNSTSFMATEDLYGFDFFLIQEGTGPSPRSGIYHEIDACGFQDTFEPFIERLKAIGVKNLVPFLNNHPEKLVRFITAWSFAAYRDDYCGGWETDYDLLGEVTLAQIGEMLARQKNTTEAEARSES